MNNYFSSRENDRAHGLVNSSWHLPAAGVVRERAPHPLPLRRQWHLSQCPWHALQNKPSADIIQTGKRHWRFYVKPGRVVHTYNPSVWEVEEGSGVQGQPGIHKTLSQKTKTKQVFMWNFQIVKHLTGRQELSMWECEFTTAVLASQPFPPTCLSPIELLCHNIPLFHPLILRVGSPIPLLIPVCVVTLVPG